MAADAQSCSDLKQTADELWVDDGSGPTERALAVPSVTNAHVTCSNAGRYSASSVISGKYQLIEVLGEGGMGSVWVARNRTLDVDVALKLMRSELADDVDGIAERMLQEARAAACIGHPAIIQVYDFGFTEYGDPFIVMELLRGESLAQALGRRRRVSVTRAAQTLLPIVDALAATHAQGIVHRDLKPANIFLARPAGQRLQPKVLDFGIAKLEQRAAGRLTQAGAVIGSPAYMSPEQFTGDGAIDGRADIWSLCIVLYEMITGRRPFESENSQGAMWWNVLNGNPRPIAELGIEDVALWAILERGFVKEPSGRYPDMRTFGRALAEWLVSHGVQEDICSASLRAWLNPGDTGVEPIASFFPSKEPIAQGPQRIVVDPLAQTLARALPSNGTHPMPLGKAAPLARVGQSERRLLWLAALGAGLAFSATAGFAAWSAASGSDKDDGTEPDPTRVSATPRETEQRSQPAAWAPNARARAVERAPVSAPVEFRSRGSERNLPTEPTNEQRLPSSDRASLTEVAPLDLRPRDASSPAPGMKGAHAPLPSAQRKKTRELKNPFE